MTFLVYVEIKICIIWNCFPKSGHILLCACKCVQVKCIPVTGDASFLILLSGLSWPKNMNLSLFCLYLTPLQVPSQLGVPGFSYIQGHSFLQVVGYMPDIYIIL